MVVAATAATAATMDFNFEMKYNINMHYKDWGLLSLICNT